MDLFLDGMVASLETLSLIVEGNDTTAFMEDPILKEMKPYLMKLNHALGLVHGKGQLIWYIMSLWNNSFFQNTNEIISRSSVVESKSGLKQKNKGIFWTNCVKQPLISI